MGKKLRIAQLTLNGYSNYGNILQKFALHYTLKKFADLTEVLWYSGYSFFSENAGKTSSQIVVRKKDDTYQQLISFRNAVRCSKFKDFENLHIRTRFDFPFFEDIADQYDYFVVGSDQVWNPRDKIWNTHKLFPNISLKFVQREKKISYAASFGVNAIPDEYKEIFRCSLSDFNHISVREESGIKIIKDLTGRDDTILVLDPVLLLAADEWLSVAQKPTWFSARYSRGYVLTYHLSKLPPPPMPYSCRQARLARHKLTRHGQLQSLHGWSGGVHLAVRQRVVCLHEFISRHGVFDFVQASVHPQRSAQCK